MHPFSVVPIAMLVALCLAIPAEAQSAQPVGPPTVDADGRVTFRRAAPDAEAVLLALEGRRPQAMRQEQEGIWSVTTDPLPPDVYTYYFFIDGAPADDPANPDRKPVMSGGSQGLVHVPGPDSLAWERGDEPQGALERLAYRSELIGEDRSAVVYLPPGYSSEESTQYPVLYLLHGVMDDESAWTTAGRADVILDNLIDAGAVPMIVVMPLGYGFPNPAERVGGLLGPMDHLEWIETFARSVESELIPAVESEYLVRADASSRAIVGLSMGGAQALYLALSRPDSFGFAGAMSGAFMMYGADLELWLGGARESSASALPGLWLLTGREDFVVGSNRSVAAWLEAADVPHEYTEVDGGHTWMVWRRALVEVLPTLFRSE